jgi:uncharacterized peroxidase-related enzyme
MALTKLIEYEDASPEVRAVYDDILATRKTDWINNVWKALANHPPTLRQFWTEVKEVMGREGGKLDPLTRELIYVAVSMTNNCEYCIRSHTAAARRKGLDDEMLGELIEVVALANKGNRLAIGYQVEVDDRFK